MSAERAPIEVDAEVMDALGRMARPFIDTTPNDVLRRLLDLDDAASSRTEPSADLVRLPSQKQTAEARDTRPRKSGPTKRTRAKKGTLLDERAYEGPILQALVEHDGRAAAREVLDRVGELVDDQLTEADRNTLNTGAVRWHSRVQFARLRLKEQGLVKKDSPRGVWEISDEGRKHLSSQSSAAA